MMKNKTRRFNDMIRDTDGTTRKGVALAKARVKQDKTVKNDLRKLREEYTRR